MANVSNERAVELYRKSRSEACRKGGVSVSSDVMEMSRRGKRSLVTMTPEQRSERAKKAAAAREAKRAERERQELIEDRERRRLQAERLIEIETFNKAHGFFVPVDTHLPGRILYP